VDRSCPPEPLTKEAHLSTFMSLKRWGGKDASEVRGIECGLGPM
jgi:hypothetical protein